MFQLDKVNEKSSSNDVVKNRKVAGTTSYVTLPPNQSYIEYIALIVSIIATIVLVAIVLLKVWRHLQLRHQRRNNNKFNSMKFKNLINPNLKHISLKTIQTDCKSLKSVDSSLSSSSISQTQTPINPTKVSNNNIESFTGSISSPTDSTEKTSAISQQPRSAIRNISSLRLLQQQQGTNLKKMVKAGANRKQLIQLGYSDNELETVGYYRINLFNENCLSKALTESSFLTTKIVKSIGANRNSGKRTTITKHLSSSNKATGNNNNLLTKDPNVANSCSTFSNTGNISDSSNSTSLDSLGPTQPAK